VPIDITINYVTGGGGTAQVKATGATLTEAAALLSDVTEFAAKAGWTQDAMAAAAAKVFPVQSTSTTSMTPPTGTGTVTSTAPGAPLNLTCVEDGTVLTPALILGKKYTAEELASGRAKKSKELGLVPVGPRCDDCWKNGGYATRYKELRGFKD